MTRTVISILIPFLAPFACYAAYVWFVNRKRAKLADGEALESWQTWPWAALVASGGALALISFIALLLGNEPVKEGQIWVPPTVVDGEIVDGHFKPAPVPVDE